MVAIQSHKPSLRYLIMFALYCCMFSKALCNPGVARHSTAPLANPLHFHQVQSSLEFSYVPFVYFILSFHFVLHLRKNKLMLPLPHAICSIKSCLLKASSSGLSSAHIPKVAISQHSLLPRTNSLFNDPELFYALSCLQENNVNGYSVDYPGT